MHTPQPNQLVSILELLTTNDLPTDDLHEQDLSLFLVEPNGDDISAVGGLERFGATALLRSVATSHASRGQGLASKLVRELEHIAVGSGIEHLYLLTESAEGYFEKLGYQIRPRDKVPESIQTSRQFSSLCPDSATVMCKPLR